MLKNHIMEYTESTVQLRFLTFSVLSSPLHIYWYCNINQLQKKVEDYKVFCHERNKEYTQSFRVKHIAVPVRL